VLVWIPNAEGAAFLGTLPSDVEVGIWNGLDPLPGGADRVELVMPSWAGKDDVVRLLGALPALKVVQTVAAGYEWLLGLNRPELSVCNAGDANAAAVADWCLAAVVSDIRRFPTFDRQQSEAVWRPVSAKPLSSHTVVIVGYGAIGKALHARLEPLGCTVVPVASRARDQIRGVDELPGLLPTADVVVLLTPLSEATMHLIDRDALRLLPDGALVVNAGRGAVVDTDALMVELGSGRLRAVLDVTDPEPLPPMHPLWHAKNVRITPHIAGATTGFLSFTYPVAGENIRRLHAGEPLLNVVQGPPVQRR
jgi:phosphoglycerate dehydrogenase-like enzyme